MILRRIVCVRWSESHASVLMLKKQIKASAAIGQMLESFSRTLPTMALSNRLKGSEVLPHSQLLTEAPLVL